MTATVRDEIVRVALAICKSRTCEGAACCQWPANMARRISCPVKMGGYDDAARDAITALATPDAGKTSAPGTEAESVWRQLSCFKDEKCRQRPCPCYDTIAAALAQAVAGEWDDIRFLVGLIADSTEALDNMTLDETCRWAAIREHYSARTDTQADGEKNG